MSAKSVNAVGHVTRPEFADFNIGRWTLCVERFFQALIEQEREHEQEQEEKGRFSAPKKVPPPTPDGREGRLFPPEQSSKTLRLLNELQAGRNNFLLKNFARLQAHDNGAKTRQSFRKIISSPNEVKRCRANRRAR